MEGFVINAYTSNVRVFPFRINFMFRTEPISEGPPAAAIALKAVFTALNVKLP